MHLAAVPRWTTPNRLRAWGALIGVLALATAAVAASIAGGAHSQGTDVLRTQAPSVHAAGDCANRDHPLFGRVGVEHYNNAERMDRDVAESILGGQSPYDYVHTFWSDQYQDKLEYVGHASRWDELVFRGDLPGRRFVGFYLAGGRLLAAVGLNRGGDPEQDPDQELAKAGKLIAARAPVDRAALEDEGRDLEALLST